MSREVSTEIESYKGLRAYPPPDSNARMLFPQRMAFGNEDSARWLCGGVGTAQ